MKRVMTTFLIFCIFNSTALAVQFDESIDADIRQNYDVAPSTLPALPNSIPTAMPDIEEITEYTPTGKTYTIKSGTKIDLQSKNTISDWTKKGTKVSFVAQNGVLTKEGTIIPAGTLLKGTIVDSHRPQLTGNGSLIELKIDEIYFNGVMSKINTKVSLANSKKIFFNNIKGQRSYWRNFSKAMKPGTKVFSVTRTCASAMAPIPVINVLSVVPLAGGVAIYTVNLAVAPFIAVFTKGGSLSLPSGTEFQIKLTENAQIKG